MNKVTKFFSEARTELMKVSWPSRAVALQLTLTVLGVSLVFAFYIAGVDVLITQGLKWITLHAKQPTQTQTIPSGSINVGDLQTTPVQ